jgi:putative ABC transport system permease protein
MSAIWLRLRSELRSRWRAWLGLALLLGMAGGAATAAAVGARRTETAYPRFVAEYKGFDLLTGGAPEGIDVAKALVTLAHLPEVKDWARGDTVAYAGFLPGGRLLTNPSLTAVTDFQGRVGSEINRWKVLSGRQFDPAALDEALIDFGTAEKYDLHVGSVIRLVVGDYTIPNPKVAPVRIVGIVAAPGGFPAVGIPTLFTTVWVTPAFGRRYSPDPYQGDSALLIRLKRGAADLPAFLRAKDRAGLGDIDVPIVEKVQTAGVQRSIRFESQALWALAALVGLASLAVLGQALGRQMHMDSDELPTLRAIGMSRRQLFALGLARSTAIGLIGAAVTVPVALLLSPLTPIGLARLAEPDPGIWVDGATLALGAALVLGLAVIVSVIPAIRVARSAGPVGEAQVERERPSPLAAALGRTSSSPAAAAGLRMALEPGRGRTAVPVRSTMFGVAVSVAALTAALLFASSLHHVLATPRLSGLTWDALVDVSQDDPEATAAFVKAMTAKVNADPRLAGFGRGGFLNVKIGGRSMFAFVASRTGPVHPVIAEGRPPVTADEIALGPGTLRATHTSVGDTIRVAMDDPEALPPVPMTIVGKAIIPPAPFGVSGPGEGAALSEAAWFRLDPSAQQHSDEAPLLVRFAPGVSTATGLAAIREDASTSRFIAQADRPGDVTSLTRIANMPVALAGLLALMAVGILAHTLITSIRRRRRDLAILKTLGFERHQIAGAVAWQATALTAMALVIGVPVGVGVGRWMWRAFADQALGVLSVPIVPLLAIALGVPIALLLANLIAALPGRSAARTRAALVLRSE